MMESSGTGSSAHAVFAGRVDSIGSVAATTGPQWARKVTGGGEMTRFDTDTLSELCGLKEVVIRSEKHLRSGVVIWVVVADDQVFVRSWRGVAGRWYRT